MHRAFLQQRHRGGELVAFFPILKGVKNNYVFCNIVTDTPIAFAYSELAFTELHPAKLFNIMPLRKR